MPWKWLDGGGCEKQLRNWLHPATASQEVLWIEGITIYVGVGAWTDHRFSVFRDNVVSIASRYCTRIDRLKWCLTTNLPIEFAVLVGSRSTERANKKI